MADSDATPDENKLINTPGAHPQGDASPGKEQQSPQNTERLEDMLSRVDLVSTNQVLSVTQTGHSSPANHRRRR